MQIKTLNCKVVTPMFSFGADPNTPELRPTELKGLMRYVYRITQQETSPQKLFTSESNYFGSVNNASPFRLQMIPDPSILYTCYKSLTIHRQHIKCYDEKGKLKPEIKSNCINTDSFFDIVIRLSNRTKIDINWYENMIRLSFYLSGMGKRTRRARGCVSINEEERNIDETKEDLRHLLNKISGQNQDIYKYKDDYIEADKVYKSKHPRPVIQRISFGNYIKADGIDNFLLAVDKVSHITKKKIGKKYSNKCATGSFKLASPIIVSVAKVVEGYLPIYTYINAVYENQAFDEDLKERLSFQKNIESEVLDK